MIETIVLVMMENRSFDHMLGHLSYEGINKDVDGLKKPLKQYQNIYQGTPIPPFKMRDGTLPADPPHEYDAVDTQLMWNASSERFYMGGFIDAFATAIGTDPGAKPLPMGFLGSQDLPITTFLAQNYCTCDRWFSALPTSTHPNRTMAFTGDSSIFRTATQLIRTQGTVFEWMKQNNVRWRVYHDGLSFFALYPQLWDDVLGPNFCDYEFLYADLAGERKPDDPQVIIVEPSYHDAPHIGPDHPNDNHAPLAVGWGEEFLRRTYQAVVANKERWGSTAMVVYYDEHGGFWDHVPPPLIPYTTTGNPAHSFNSLGPRIPGIIVSPLVEAGSVSHDILDHTSVLQLLADVFTPGQPYSDSVRTRAQDGVASLFQLITRAQPRDDTPPAPADAIPVKSALGASIIEPPHSEMQRALENAAMQMLDERREETLKKYPELLQWRDAVATSRGSSVGESVTP